MQKESSIENGKKGGRPKYENAIKVTIPDTELITLTQAQYKILLKKYGSDVLNKAILLFEEWLKSSPEGIKYKGKNNYGHFRSDGWVINSVIN
jgi:hypothetical protein